MHKVNRNTKYRTLYTYKAVPTGHVGRVPCNLPGMSEPKQCCGRRHLPYSVVGALKLPYQANTVNPPMCLWASTVWQAPISAIPEEDDATSHMHLTSTVLWALAFTIPGEYSKTAYMPLGINSMAGTDDCHTRRRRRNLPHASNINSVVGAYNHLVPDSLGNKT